ncbi:hypothetical protein BY458DRAFT_502190 [Sporodiniella umbellata]|nr:hypothetical protein BY458DRAFT_502190 [Sporodiniella umbellata]
MFTKSLQRSDPKPNFSTSPYNDAVQRIKSQAKLAGKITGYTVLSVSAALGIIWQMSHWYIEYRMESTPVELGYKGRNLLHGAYYRESIAPDYEIATVYIREVLRVALEEQNLAENSDVVIDLRLRLAQDEDKSGNLLEAITESTRAWKLLLEKEVNKKAIGAAKHIGDLYMRIGDLEHAEEYLAWALHASQKADKGGMLDLKIKLSLANLYAIQRNFLLAQPLLSQVLQSLPESEICLKAIVQNQISEIKYGLKKTEESMGWAQAALNTCSKDTGNQDCLECGAVVSNNLGTIFEAKGEFEQAVAYYTQAVNYSSNIDDSVARQKYILNSERVQDILAKKELEGK